VVSSCERAGFCGAVSVHTFLYRYIYKRLKFLGNRYISQAAALTFLAVWHGLHSGYYMCFLLEFGVMKLEKDVSIDVLNFRLHLE
jgi:lysophospholipid acyltransferase 5